jgi:hypothetical protein
VAGTDAAPPRLGRHPWRTGRHSFVPRPRPRGQPLCRDRHSDGPRPRGQGRRDPGGRGDRVGVERSSTPGERARHRPVTARGGREPNGGRHGPVGRPPFGQGGGRSSSAGTRFTSCVRSVLRRGARRARRPAWPGRSRASTPGRAGEATRRRGPAPAPGEVLPGPGGAGTGADLVPCEEAARCRQPPTQRSTPPWRDRALRRGAVGGRSRRVPVVRDDWGGGCHRQGTARGARSARRSETVPRRRSRSPEGEGGDRQPAGWRGAEDGVRGGGRGRAGISRTAIPGPVAAADPPGPGPARRPGGHLGGARPARIPGRGWAAAPAPAGGAGGPPGRGAGRPAGEPGPDGAPQRGKAPRAGSWGCSAAR